MKLKFYLVIVVQNLNLLKTCKKIQMEIYYQLEGVIMSNFFDGWYDETPLKNQELQVKYGLNKEFINLLFTENLTPAQHERLDILHHGTEEQIKKLAESK